MSKVRELCMCDRYSRYHRLVHTHIFKTLKAVREAVT